MSNTNTKDQHYISRCFFNNHLNTNNKKIEIYNMKDNKFENAKVPKSICYELFLFELEREKLQNNHKKMTEEELKNSLRFNEWENKFIEILFISQLGIGE